VNTGWRLRKRLADYESSPGIFLTLFAQAGDICVLDRISNVMAGPSAASSSSDLGSRAPEEGIADSEGGQGVGRDKDTCGIEGARICATLSQMTVVLEQKGTG
jgi:separase